MSSGEAGEPSATPADAIVVLGCRVLVCGRLTAAAEGRASAAAAAYRAGMAPRIVASGGRRWGSQIESVALKQSMVAQGVPEGAIVAELWSLTTYENAIFSAAMLRKAGARRALIVTCAWHLPRALMSFRSAGIDAAAWPREAAERNLARSGAETLRRLYDKRALRWTSTLAQHAASFLSARREQIWADG
jgi:uncharacterized SAM-binding protein YcdF (DUF218 family)